MARNSVPSWREAILSVLEQSKGQPLGREYIAERAYDLRLSQGGGTVDNPLVGVYYPLRTLLENGMVRESRSGYVLSKSRGKRVEKEPKTAKEERAKRADLITVTSYGLNWRVDHVDWTKANGQLLGKADAGDSHAVDFAGQDAVYLLKRGDGIVYVGQTSEDTKSASLYRRLQSHYRDKVDRWDTFSWFGFRPVNKEGQLSSARGMANASQVIKLIEAILIEALPVPALNKQRGKDAKGWTQYRQQRDPTLN